MCTCGFTTTFTTDAWRWRCVPPTLSRFPCVMKMSAALRTGTANSKQHAMHTMRMRFISLSIFHFSIVQHFWFCSITRNYFSFFNINDIARFARYFEYKTSENALAKMYPTVYRRSRLKATSSLPIYPALPSAERATQRVRCLHISFVVLTSPKPRVLWCDSAPRLRKVSPSPAARDAKPWCRQPATTTTATIPKRAPDARGMSHAIKSFPYAVAERHRLGGTDGNDDVDETMIRDGQFGVILRLYAACTRRTGASILLCMENSTFYEFRVAIRRATYWMYTLHLRSVGCAQYILVPKACALCATARRL